jgi:competence protein ComEC
MWAVFVLAALTCFWSPVDAALPPGTAVNYKTLSKSSAKLRVHIIDIGAGDAILIETPNADEKHVFIDGGKAGMATTLKPYLKHFIGTNRIDLAIVTHPDFDHINGMKSVFESYAVHEYWDTGYDSPKLSDTWRELQTLVGDEPTCATYSPISGYYLPGDREVIDENETTDPTDDVILQFINVNGSPPFKDPKTKRKFKESERRNNASLVLKLIYKNVSFLLTGDINGRNKDHIGEVFDDECDSVEQFLIDLNKQELTPTAGFLAATVLKAPHHGSNGSSSLEFIKQVHPEWVVFSAGHEFDHPHPDALRRYGKAGIPTSQLLRTDEGDSTPEDDGVRDGMGDDTFVFETDGLTITSIKRVKINL